MPQTTQLTITLFKAIFLRVTLKHICKNTAFIIRIDCD